MNDKVVVLVVEDDQMIQALVEEAISEGGFQPAVAASGEEATKLLQVQKSDYRALVTDRHPRRGLALQRSAQQHPADLAFCARTACHRHFSTSKCRPPTSPTE